MVATVAPEVFTDWKRQSAELHIARLFQVNKSILTFLFFFSAPVPSSLISLRPPPAPPPPPPPPLLLLLKLVLLFSL